MTSLSLMHSTPSQPGWRRLSILGGILCLHAVVAYALTQGMLHRVAEVLPKEIVLSVVTPDTKPATPPAPLKTVTLTQPAIPQFSPPLPTVAPVENQIVQASPAAAEIPTSRPADNPPASVVATAPPASNPPKTISGLEYLSPPRPDYPVLSRRKGEEGKVVLRVRVNEHGQPEVVEVHRSSGSTRLDEAGRAALLRARFKPYLEDGKAQTVYAFATISFDLNA